MAKQSPAQQDTVERVMREFKEGDLEGRDGKPIRNRKQAIAIALHESGQSNQETPAANKRNLARTKRRERTAGEAGPSKAELYAKARQHEVAGRSKMTKAELARAVQP